MTERGLYGPGEHWSQEPRVTDQLCQSVAHDLRGVLMAIQLSAEELIVPGTNVAELQGEIQAAIERATALVAELTTLTRPDGGHSEVFDVSLLLDRMQNMLRRNAPSDALVRFELAGEACCLQVPRMAFKRLFLTLFNRVAARLAPKGTLTIATTVSRAPGTDDPADSGARVVVAVGSGDGSAEEWRKGTAVFAGELSSPATEELLTLVRRLDAELYALGSLESSSRFWLCIPSVKPIARPAQR